MSDRITRDDIEKKIREIQGGIESDVGEAKALAVPAIVAIVLVLLGLAYAIGRRGGKKKSMILEIKSN
ncbi:MAG: hypothetical protein DCC49_01370 [Acidobacteria bacterium]|nr:MAG: hypothetical protein DCC49_01370 [Acidobacteriota bacterium]